MSQQHRQTRADRVQVSAARAAMVRETIALDPTGVALENTFRVDGRWLQRKNMGLVEFVIDLLRKIVAFLVEGETAQCAGVSSAGGLEFAGGALRNCGVRDP